MWLHAPEAHPRRPRPFLKSRLSTGRRERQFLSVSSGIHWVGGPTCLNSTRTWFGWLAGSVEIRMAVLSFPAMGWARGSLRHRQPSTRRAMGLIAVSRVWLRTSVSGTIWSAP